MRRIVFSSLRFMAALGLVLLCGPAGYAQQEALAPVPDPGALADPFATGPGDVGAREQPVQPQTTPQLSESQTENSQVQPAPVIVSEQPPVPSGEAVTETQEQVSGQSEQQPAAPAGVENVPGENGAVPPDTVLQPVSESGEEHASAPAVVQPEGEGEDLFYDANSLVPEGEIGKRTGPRKLDPRLQPASRLVVVTEDAGKDTAKAQIVSAERAQALGRFDAAAQIYDNLYKKNKRDPRVLMGRAVVLQKMGRFDEAIHAYQELLDIRPNNVEAQVNMLGLMTEKYPSVALRRLLELSKKDPENAGLLAQVAVAESKLGNFDDALRYLGMAVSIEPQNAGHMFNMAVTADRAGHKAEAIKYYEKALEIDAVNGGAETIPRDAVYERLAKLR